MRKLILTATGLVCLAGITCFLGSALGQGKKEAAEETPHRIGLIDMGYVFDNYEKLKNLREELKAEAQDREARFKVSVKKLQETGEELKALNEGTSEFTKCEQRYAKLASECETARKMGQRDLARSEAKMYHTVYLEVQDAVEKFCNYHKFTLIIRFSRNDQNSSDPAKQLQSVNQTVVYHRKKDDLTDGVLKYLNEKYLQAAEGGAKAPAEAKAEKPSSKKISDKSIKPAGGP